MNSPKQKRKIDGVKAAKSYFREGKPLSTALREAGASEAQSKKSRGLLFERPYLLKAFQKERAQMKRLQLLGQSMDAEGQTDFVRGTLTDVAISVKGNERVTAATALGKDRRVNLFTPDTQVGLFSLNVPPGWESRYEIITTESPSALSAQGAETIPVLLPAEPPKEAEDEKLRRVTRELAGPLKDAAVHANPDLQREKIKQSKQPPDCYPSGTFRSNK